LLFVEARKLERQHDTIGEPINIGGRVPGRAPPPAHRGKAFIAEPIHSLPPKHPPAIDGIYILQPHSLLLKVPAWEINLRRQSFYSGSSPSALAGPTWPFAPGRSLPSSSGCAA